MISGRQWASLAVAGCGAAALWIIGIQPDVEAYGNDLGPKLLPTIAAGLILLLAAADFVLALSRRSRAANAGPADDQDVRLGRQQLLSILLVSVVTVAFAFILFPLGYLLSAFLVIAVLMFGIGARSPLPIVLLSAAGAAVLYAGMTFGFGALLPALPELAFGGRP